MLLFGFLDLGFVELLEEFLCCYDFNHGLACFGLDFLLLDDRLHEVGKKNFVRPQIVNQPIHKPHTLEVQNAIVEIYLIGFSFWDFEVLDTERF